MVDATDRLALPLLQSGQSQKEITHNEALIRIDALLHLAVESQGEVGPPLSPEVGQAWIVAAPAIGAWVGREGWIAAFHAGGWAFAEASEGWLAWVRNEGVFAYRVADGWRSNAWPVKGLSVSGDAMLAMQQPAIASPAGGEVVDVQARHVLGQVLSALRTHGLIGI